MLNPRPPAIVLGALCSMSAWAGPNAALHAVGGVGWNYDDNLLRIPDGEPAFDNTRGDSWVQAQAGVLFDKTWSRQRIAASAMLSKVKFDHFSQLDYDGKDVQATWYWQLGNHLEGQAGATYAQVLAPYTDFRSNERNLRQQRRGFLDGAWRFHPSWRARAAVSSDKYTYELATQRFNNRTEDTCELEGDYLPKSGSTVGLVLRRIKGKYPNRRPFGGLLLDDDFTQDELKARVDWLATGVTTVQVLAGWARRDQPSFGGATSGLNGRISAIVAPAGKLSYNAALWRDFAALESTVVSATLNKGASVGATWQPGAKLKLDANAIYERRSYNARFAFPGAGSLRDSVRTATVRALWTVRPTLQLSATLAHHARSGSPVLGIGSFSANSISLNASAQF